MNIICKALELLILPSYSWIYFVFLASIDKKRAFSFFSKFVLFQCLFSSVAFSFGCSYIAKYEQQGEGIQWSNLAVSPTPGDGFNMGVCMAMMLVDSLLYWIITWYMETAFPG